MQNIKSICKLRGIAPTAACKESGVGASFINDINRGQTPSVAKVQLLAQYLGVTVSDLLGEEPAPSQEVRDALTRYLAQSVKDQPNSKQKEPISIDRDGQSQNIIKIAGRDGSLIERRLTDEQVAALKLMLAQLPEVDDL